MSGQRKYEMEVTTSYEAGLQLIRAALDDEGLALGPKAGSMDNVRTVIVGGRKVFFVPESRIMSPEANAAFREQFEKVLG